MNLDILKSRIHRYLNRNMAAILTYHSVIDVPLPFPLWTHLPLQLFAEHMALLRNEANVISLQEMTQGILNGKLPKYSVAITFDDGYRNNFTRAYPVLQQYGIPATVFLSTGYMDRSELFWPEKIAYLLMRTKRQFLETASFGQLNLETSGARRTAFSRIRNAVKGIHPYRISEKIAELEANLGVSYGETDPLFIEWLPLAWKEIRVMEKDGLISFGGHTANHAILTRLEDQEAMREIVECRSALDAQLSRKSVFWAHPNGTRQDYSACHIDMLTANSFQTILTAEPGRVSSRSDIKMLPRLGISSRSSTADLRSRLVNTEHLEHYRGIRKVAAMVLLGDSRSRI